MLSDYGKLDENKIRFSIHNDPKIKVVQSETPHIQNIKLLSLIRLLMFLPLIKQSDLIVHLAADGFSDKAIDGKMSTLYNSALLLIAKFFRKPTFLLSANIGPFSSRPSRFLGLLALKRVDGVSVRQGSTERYLKQVGFRNFSPVADLAFLVEENSTLPRLPDSAGLPYASLVISYHMLKSVPNYINILTEVVDGLCQRGFFVIIIPQITHGRFCEVLLAEKLSCRVERKKQVMVLPDLLPSGMKYVFKNSKVVISSKFHGSVLSFSADAPTIGLDYSPKMKDLFGQMNMTDCLVSLVNDWDDLVSVILQKIDFLISDQQVKEEIAVNVEIQRILALKNIELIEPWL